MRSRHDPHRERAAVWAWRERHSLLDRLRRLWLLDPARAWRLARHMERWGWPGRRMLEDLAQIPPVPCVCGGRGFFDRQKGVV